MSEQNNQGYQQHVHQAYPNYYYPYYSQAYYPTQARQYTNHPPAQTYLPQQQQPFPNQQQQQQQQGSGMLPLERSYIENILRLNRGKIATVYMSFEDDGRQTFTGVIEAAGRDHIILSDPDSGKRYLLLMVYLDYVTFDEEINYEYPYGSTGQSPLTSNPPR